MMTVQCSDVSQSLCAYFKLKWGMQNITNLRDAKKGCFHVTFYRFFFLTLFGNCSCRVVEMETEIQGKGNASHILKVKESFPCLFDY